MILRERNRRMGKRKCHSLGDSAGHRWHSLAKAQQESYRNHTGSARLATAEMIGLQQPFIDCDVHLSHDGCDA